MLRAPLCPAGHLPHEGGDWQFRSCRPSCNVSDWRKPARHPISPLEGEMSGRTEGGAVELCAGDHRTSRHQSPSSS
ncbi:hypothetical protein EOC94_10130 [Mesorhizobium sp. M6A.T.Ce.TU.016.01.1.1]|nr:hypothetical protein EOC94_10130 [Mesorhizobium sp. M6A.T.Ce.TU.016.01.1.1]